MIDEILKSETPPGEDDGWIEYAILKLWEYCDSGEEHICDNAAAELARLRSELDKARKIAIYYADKGVGVRPSMNAQRIIEIYRKEMAKK